MRINPGPTGLEFSKRPAQAGGGTIIGLGEVLRGAAVDVQIVAKSPVQIFGDSQFQRCIQVKTCTPQVCQTGIDDGSDEKVRSLEPEEIYLGAQDSFQTVSGLVNSRLLRIVLTVPDHAAVCGYEAIVRIAKNMP